MQTPWSHSGDDIIKHWQSHIEQGLTESEATTRLTQYGPNTIILEPGPSRLQIFLFQFKGPIVVVLSLGMGVSFALKKYLDGASIGLILLLNAFIGYFQEFKAEESILALKKLSVPQAKVLRDGKVIMISSDEIVPGDILVLEAGDFVVADARILSARQLAVDESVLTGESIPVEKETLPLAADVPLADRKNMLFSGTNISAGSVKAVVTGTGGQTEVGKIASMMAQSKPGPTPLQKRLEKVSQRLLGLGGIVAVLVVVAGIYKGLSFEMILMEAISLTVAAIPEGLPTVVTLALVMAVYRMSKKKVIMRKMPAVETLGSTDIICSDKTGTLTTGKMQVRELFLLNGDLDRALEALILCNNASLEGVGVGDSTEVALLAHAKDQKNITETKSLFPRLYEWSFDSDRKRMSVAVQSQDRTILYLKGAPESVLSRSQLSEEERAHVQKRLTDFSSSGMRTLALAYKILDVKQFDKVHHDEVENGMTFIGLVALADPPRSESIDAIARCRKAGIKVMMITGDHPLTARSMAFELGLTENRESRVLTGVDLDQMSDQEFEKDVEEVLVYARVSPEHKLRIVSLLEKHGHTVAMTGDGVNDGPALKRASIGIAMGKSGTEVARQASAMILTDDNFASIVDAVEEGRALHSNIRRTLQYLLSTNLAEIMVVLGASFVGLGSPLSPLAILWINLVTDGLPSLSLAVERVPDHFIENSTRPSPESFFNTRFYVELFSVGLLIAAMALGVYFWVFKTSGGGASTAASAAFTFMVYSILLRSFSSRSDSLTYFQLRINWFHLVSVAIPMLLQWGLVSWEVTRNLFQIEKLSWEMNFYLLGAGLIPVTILELIKIVRQKTQHP